MHDEHGPVEVSEEAIARGYETRDIAIPILLKWGLGLVIFFLVSAGIVWLIYSALITWRTPEKPLFASQPGDLPPAQAMRNAGIPVVQAQPVPDIKEFRSTEDDRVEGYGTWVDGDHKTVKHIPLHRAMQIIERNGLPSVPVGGNMPIRTSTKAVPTQTQAPSVIPPPSGVSAPVTSGGTPPSNP